MTKKAKPKPKKKNCAELDTERPGYMDLDLSMLDTDKEFIDAQLKEIHTKGIIKTEEQ